MTPTGESPWVDKRGLALHLACSVRSIETAIVEGMPHAVIFGRVKFQIAEVEAWLEAHRQLAEDPSALTIEQLAPLLRAHRKKNRHRLIWVYAIQAGENGPIKIGITSGSPAKRLKTLQTGNAEKLRGLAAWTDFPEAEKYVHEDFAHARLHGEWFNPIPELVDYVLLQGASFCDW